MDVNLVQGPGEVPIDPKSEAEEKELFRNEDLKDSLHTIFKIFIYVAFGIFMIVFCCRAFSYHGSDFLALADSRTNTRH